MSSEWYYQLFGEEFGPVTLEDLEDLVASETLAPTDLVRQGTSGGWKAVSSITRASSGGETPPTATVTIESDSVTPETGWYYESLGCTLGPITFDELAQHAESGELGPDDDVWMGQQGKRRRAGSIGRLMAAMPFQSSTVTIENRPATKSPSDTDIFDSDTTLREPSQARPTPPQPVAAPPKQEQLWYAWIRGQEFGPVSLQDLQQWYRDQRLTVNDAVKPGLYGVYQPVATATFLWAAPAAPTPSAPVASPSPSPAPVAQVAPAPPKPVAPAAVEKPAVAAPPARPVESAKPVETVAKVEVPKPTPKVEPVAPKPEEPKPEPVTVAAPIEAPKPVVEAPKSAPASFSSPPAWSAPKPMAAPARPAPPKSSPKRSSGGGGFDLGGLFSGLSGSSTGMAIGGVVVVGLLVGGWMLIPESKGNLVDYYNTMSAMAAEIGKMRAANAGDAEWKQFGQKSMQTLEPISKELEASLKSAPKSSLKPVRQNLFYASKYRFKDVFEKPLKEKTRSEEDVKLHLTEAARLLKLPPPSL